MSDLLTVPAAHRDNISAIADFAEIECLRRNDWSVSINDIVHMIQREADANDIQFHTGIEQYVSDSFGDMELRFRHCGHDGSGYPFELSEDGTLLRMRSLGMPSYAPPVQLYLYLLLITRMDMRTDRVQGGKDATRIFEELSKEVGVRFLGGPNGSVRGLVFGTGRRAGMLSDEADLSKTAFARRVNSLCQQLCEGLDFNPHPNTRLRARDGKLDVVVWRGFTDRRSGQLIAFGQCKTGKHWRDDLTKLQPEDFCQKWMRKPPAVKPVRLYFISDRVLLSEWYERCVDGGILFDRCRIVEYAGDLPPGLLRRIDMWVRAACKIHELKLP
ncbi:MAG: hypothetical protein HY706_08290 [Candidatus Hydrogenedentes bacterium]|nr:hypothetical protein [Candidatus Hydrogenedentota bacterium]